MLNGDNTNQQGPQMSPTFWHFANHTADNWKENVHDCIQLLPFPFPVTERALLVSCFQASGETLTGVGSLENPLLIGSMFDTVSNQPQRKQVTTTSTWANDRREVVVKGVEDYKYILFIITQAGVSRNYFLHTVICAEYHLEFLKSLLRMSFLKSAP